MTNREFYTKVIETCDNEELVAFAKEGIVKLDTKNAKRANTPSKNAIANAPYRDEIMSILASVGVPMKASDILVALNHEGFTTQKVNGLLGVLVKEGKVTKALESGVAKSKAKTVYSLVD